MAARFDDDAKAVELSVADLLDRQPQTLGFANRGGYERLWLGQAIHSRYQEEALAADGSYRREVKLELELTHRGWVVHLTGRADGLRRTADGTLVVEEIKSVRRGTQLAPATQDLYQRQALLYAWMLRTGGEERVAAELVLIEIGTDEVERLELELAPAAIEGEVRRQLSTLLRRHQQERAAAAARRELATRLAFPHQTLRPGQEAIVAAVEQALANRDHLLVEAPTGIGKTAAALHPALLYSLAHDKRLFVLTAKTLQQEMAIRVLEQLNEDGTFHSLQLRAKRKMCANSEVICHEEYCAYARDFYAKLKSSGIRERLLEHHPTLLPDRIYAAAVRDEVCPFEISLDLQGTSQVTVCDYNYAFEPTVALSELGADSPLGDTILLIDEIHNLVERGRGYYSPRLDAGECRRAADLLRHDGTPMHRRLARLAQALGDLVEERVGDSLGPPDGRDQAVETALPEDELFALRPELDAGFVDYLEHQREHKSFRAEDPFVALYFDVLRFLNVMILIDDAFATLAQRPAGGAAQLQILCKDPSRFLGQVINRCHSVIGLSATLSPSEFYRDLLGFSPHRTATVSFDHPFPAENRAIVIDASVETAYRVRRDNYDPIARRLGELAGEVPGNCLVLFPSYDFLAAVAERLEVPGKRILVQQRTDSDAAREALLDALRGAMFGDVLLLAVAGGVFAEGVDYPGDMLKAVAVVGPCLPAVSLERQLLRDYYQERFERGFEYAYVVPGMTRVVQAAGRLLRSPQDRGVIALFDRRFLAQPYRSHLPSHWHDGDGAGALQGDPGDVARRFFGREALALP